METSEHMFQLQTVRQKKLQSVRQKQRQKQRQTQRLKQRRKKPQSRDFKDTRFEQ